MSRAGDINDDQKSTLKDMVVDQDQVFCPHIAPNSVPLYFSSLPQPKPANLHPTFHHGRVRCLQVIMAVAEAYLLDGDATDFTESLFSLCKQDYP